MLEYFINCKQLLYTTPLSVSRCFTTYSQSLSLELTNLKHEEKQQNTGLLLRVETRLHGTDQEDTVLTTLAIHDVLTSK